MQYILFSLENRSSFFRISLLDFNGPYQKFFLNRFMIPVLNVAD